MSRLAIFIFVMSVASVVFLQGDAGTTQQLSVSSNPERELTGEWDEANDEEEMNDEDEDAELAEGDYNEDDEVADSHKEYYYNWIDKEDEPMNSELEQANDARRRRRRCRFFCRLTCFRLCRRCRRICRLRCRRVCFRRG
ncbi:PREDICTED: uncharacterized protein LOC107343129 [Acropora digitifera]|uniref:uncharacterized protein LOC107343129 n=1 Tax=Acropora digitifera TaxID=70779 RepID=UPI00077B07F2|nr:PREDICTED: uncharacterized protein LOC107343129 [Acropora digitifera]